jgi:hypothetical protein
MGKLPAMIPSKIRPTNKNKMLGAQANTNQPIAVLKMLMIRSGRLPNLSERAPMIGALKNEHRAKTEKSDVMSRADELKVET